MVRPSSDIGVISRVFEQSDLSRRRVVTLNPQHSRVKPLDGGNARIGQPGNHVEQQPLKFQPLRFTRVRAMLLEAAWKRVILGRLLLAEPPVRIRSVECLPVIRHAAIPVP